MMSTDVVPALQLQFFSLTSAEVGQNIYLSQVLLWSSGCRKKNTHIQHCRYLQPLTWYSINEVTLR